jgi:hypothetical protein
MTHVLSSPWLVLAWLGAIVVLLVFIGVADRDRP